MALLLKNRVLETCTSPGTGSVTLLGATTGYQSFNTAYSATSSTVYYTIADQGGPNWEVGVGTFTPTATLSRDTVLSSSAGGTTKVNFSSGTQNVWVDYPSEKAVIVNDLGDVLINQSTDQGTGVLQVTGQSTFNGAVTDKSLNLQGGNNLLTYSQDFTNAAWTKSGSTVTAAATTAPDGTTTGQLVTYSSIGSRITQAITATGTSYTYSFYVKNSSGNGCQLTIYNNTTSTSLLSASFTGATFTAPVNGTSTSVGNGWYRISVSISTGISVGNTVTFYLYTDTAGGTVASSAVYAWGAQLELGTVASAYTPTTTAAITTTNNISVPSGQVLGSYNTNTLPAYSFLTATNTGFWFNKAGNLYGSRYTANATDVVAFNNNGVGVPSTLGYSFSSDANPENKEFSLLRDSANTLAQRNSTNAQTFRLYNTYTDASNYERLSIDWSSQANTAVITTQGAGTGVVRNMSIRASALYLGGNSATQIYLNGNGIFPQVDATYDLGGASTVRWRNAYFSGVVTTNSDASINGVTVGLGGGAVSTNTAVGYQTIGASNTGARLVGVGQGALYNNTSGNDNTGIGQSTLFNNTTGGTNFAGGGQSLYQNISGSNNSALGFKSLFQNISGSGNCSTGYFALTNNTTASNLTAFGTQTLINNTTNVATLGTITGGTGYTNGTYTGVVMTLSSGSTAITYPTATIVVSGGAVTSVTLTSNGVGFKDTTTVLTAPAASIGGTGSGFSVPVATLASGTGNVAVGYQAGYSNTTGVSNTYAGYQSGFTSTTATDNAAFGYFSLRLATTGSYNAAFGDRTLQNCTTGVANTGINYNAFGSLTTGSNNTGVGYSAGATGTNDITTGSNNTFLGSQTRGSALDNTNSIVIGYQAVGLGSNTTVIGNSSTTLTKVFGAIQATTYTVATLPSASTSGVGARAFVTDALAPSFGVAVTGGGAVPIPVYSTGSAWNVG